MTKDDKEITSRLDAILRVVLDYKRETKGTTVGDQILVMMDSGLSQADSARVLGVEPNQVPSYLRRAKNKSLLKKLKGG